MWRGPGAAAKRGQEVLVQRMMQTNFWFLLSSDTDVAHVHFGGAICICDAHAGDGHPHFAIDDGRTLRDRHADRHADDISRRQVAMT